MYIVCPFFRQISVPDAGERDPPGQVLGGPQALREAGRLNQGHQEASISLLPKWRHFIIDVFTSCQRERRRHRHGYSNGFAATTPNVFEDEDATAAEDTEAETAEDTEDDDDEDVYYEVPAASPIDVKREMRAQKFLLFIAFVYFICLLPLNVLK